MKFFILGLIVLIAGIPLLDVNFYLGTACIGIGAITAATFKGQVMRTIMDKVTGRK